MLAQGARTAAIAGLLAGLVLCAPPAPAAAGPARDSDPVSPAPGTVFVRVAAAPAGRPLPAGFLGVSTEFTAIRTYMGRDANQLDPVALELIRALARGQSPSLRIGGDSTDWSWWPQPGLLTPAGVSYTLTRGWVAVTRAMAAALGAKLVLGLNMASGRPEVAAAEARALVAGLGADRIAAFEIGNEPDVYGQLPWYRAAGGTAVYARPPGYDLTTYTSEFSAFRAATGALPAAGPAFAHLSWMSGLSGFLAAEPGLAMATFHRYPLRGCGVTPAQPTYPTVSNLLSDYATTDLAAAVSPFASAAHAAGVPFRLDELNSVACSGRTSVSDTFASALWMLDTLLAMDGAGVDGVNVHTLPGSAYELFTVTHDAAGWHAFVHPDYYGMLAFARAAPPGSALLPVSGATGQLKVYATRAPGGTLHAVLINKDVASAHLVVLTLPGGAGTATAQTLTAPSATATAGVTLAGQSFGPSTSTGTLPGSPSSEAIPSLTGTYWVRVPAGSAVLLTR